MTGPALAVTDEATGYRRYIHPLTGESVPSVTTIMKSLPKQDILVPWAARMGAEHADANWARLSTLPHGERVEEIKNAHKVYTDKRAAVGTEVHELIDCWSTGTPFPEVTKEVKLYARSFTKFMMSARPEFLENEVTVWSRSYGYAGTADFIARIDGRIVLGDVKCLVPETLITMADGTEKAAGLIHHGDEVAAWDEATQMIVPARVLASGDNGVRPVYTLHTKCGRVLSVTGEHPVLTRTGWVKAADLQSGDHVRTGSPSVPRGDYDLEEAYYLGLVVGDGSVSSGKSVRVTTIDPLVVDFLDDFGKQYGLSLSKDNISYTLTQKDKSRNFPNPLTDLIRRCGLAGTVAKTKFVPEQIMSGGSDAWRYFLAGYLDTDGCVRVKDPSKPKGRRCGTMVSWGSVSERLLRQCQGMLTGLGVRSSVYRVRTTYKGEPYVFWQLAVRDKEALRRLQQLMPERGGRTRQLRAVVIPERSARDNATGVVEWDEIRSVEVGEAKPTVWVEVADYHTHITGGIVSHNSGKRLYPEVGIQLSALAHADFIIRTDGTEEPLPPIERMAGLLIRPRSWKLQYVKFTDECFAAFCAAKQVQEWETNVAPYVLEE